MGLSNPKGVTQIQEVETLLRHIWRRGGVVQNIEHATAAELVRGQSTDVNWSTIHDDQ